MDEKISEALIQYSEHVFEQRVSGELSITGRLHLFHYNEWGDSIQAIPLIEREGLKDVNEYRPIMINAFYHLRPKETINPTTIARNLSERNKLLRWLNDNAGQNLSPEVIIQVECNDLLASWNAGQYLSNVVADSEDNDPMIPLSKYPAGTFRPSYMRQWRGLSATDNIDICLSAIYAALHKGKKATIKQIISEYYDNEADRTIMTHAIDDTTKRLTILAYTYNLFATESFDAIKDCDHNTQIIALKNYFSCYLQYKDQQKLYGKTDFPDYYKTSALHKTCSAMGIPLTLQAELTGKKLTKAHDRFKANKDVITGIVSTEADVAANAIMQHGWTTYDSNTNVGLLGMCKLLEDLSNTSTKRGDYYMGNVSNYSETIKVSGHTYHCPILQFTMKQFAQAISNMEHPSGQHYAKAEKIIQQLANTSYWLPFSIVEHTDKKGNKVLRQIWTYDKFITPIRETEATMDGEETRYYYKLHPVFSNLMSMRHYILLDKATGSLTASATNLRIPHSYEPIKLYIELNCKGKCKKHDIPMQALVNIVKETIKGKRGRQVYIDKVTKNLSLLTQEGMLLSYTHNTDKDMVTIEINDQ